MKVKIFKARLENLGEGGGQLGCSVNFLLMVDSKIITCMNTKLNYLCNLEKHF